MVEVLCDMCGREIDYEVDGADLKAEAVAVIEHIAQYMEKDVLLNHSRPLALAYLALTEEVDSVPVVRCKDCKHEFGGSCIICGFQKRKPEDFCSYGERKGKNETERT